MSVIRPNPKSRSKPTNLPRVKVDLSKLKKRDYIIGNSDDLVHMDWSSEWNELKNLEPLPHGRGSESALGNQTWPKSRKPTKSGVNS
jgi:hypothetical protein